MPAGFIDGALVDGAGETVSVQSPSTEEEIARTVERFAGYGMTAGEPT